MPFDSLEVASVVLPKISSILSLIGSLFLVQHVLRSPKRRNEPYHRLVLGMSISDCIGNFVYFTGTWLVPKDSPVSPIWAMGNQVTCEVQGFMYQLAGIATPGYNVMLSLYYLLVVRYGWCERRIKQVESYLHAYPIIFGFGSSIAGLPLKLYNNEAWLCWISSFPRDCYDGVQKGGDKTKGCERGEYAYIYQWLFFYAPLWVGFIIMMCSMYLVYGAVLRTEQRTDRYIITPHTQISAASDKKRKISAARTNNRRNSRRVAKQCFYFIGAFCLTWGVASLARVTDLFIDDKIRGPVLSNTMIILTATTVPLQGFCNAFIYLRPRYEHYRKRHHLLTSWQIWAKIISESWEDRRWYSNCSFGGCCSSGNTNNQNQMKISDGRKSTQPLQKSRHSSVPEISISIAEEANSDDDYSNEHQNDDDGSIDDVNDNSETEFELELEMRKRASSRLSLMQRFRYSHQMNNRFTMEKEELASDEQEDKGSEQRSISSLAGQDKRDCENYEIDTGRQEQSQQDYQLRDVVPEQFHQHHESYQEEPEQKMSEDL